MTEHFKDNPSSDSPQDEPDVMALLKKIQLQLVYLEKKVDTLINQPQGGSSFRGPERGDNRGGDRFARPRRPFSGGRPDYRRQEGPRRFDKPSHSDRPDRRFDKPHFDKPQSGGEQRGFSPKKKKPFFRKD